MLSIKCHSLWPLWKEKSTKIAKQMADINDRVVATTWSEKTERGGRRRIVGQLARPKRSRQ